MKHKYNTREARADPYQALAKAPLRLMLSHYYCRQCIIKQMQFNKCLALMYSCEHD